MNEGRGHFIVCKTNWKKLIHDREKPSAVFVRVMPNVYGNDIFPALPYDRVEIHNIS